MRLKIMSLAAHHHHRWKIFSCFAHAKPMADRFYKMVMAQAGSLSFDLSLLDSDVSLYHRDAKKNVVNDALSKSQVDAHTMRYHAQVNAGTYYVKVHKVVKSPIGAYYTITRQS